ncbi:MAG: hypothetical protein ACI8RE_001250 [Ilumatobacter sp.]|jgi:uncharacterized protein (DUF952 family)
MTDTGRQSGDEPIFHIALPEDWQGAFETGEYRWSTRGQTLDAVGFIHCSTAVQVEITANRYYTDLSNLVLLTIDPVAIPSEVLWEPPAPGVDELFPHVYGPIPIAAVNMTTMWTRQGEGWVLRA